MDEYVLLAAVGPNEAEALCGSNHFTLPVGIRFS
jgi:hypothetical protein